MQIGNDLSWGWGKRHQLRSARAHMIPVQLRASHVWHPPIYTYIPCLGSVRRCDVLIYCVLKIFNSRDNSWICLEPATGAQSSPSFS